MNAYTIANKLAAVLFSDNPDQLRRDVVEFGGITYLVISGTGDGCFAYNAADVEAWIDGRDEDTDEEVYQDFCDSLTANSSRELAVAVYLDCKQVICEEGTCYDALEEDELALLDIVREVI